MAVREVHGGNDDDGHTRNWGRVGGWHRRDGGLQMWEGLQWSGLGGRGGETLQCIITYLLHGYTGGSWMLDHRMHDAPLTLKCMLDTTLLVDM